MTPEQEDHLDQILAKTYALIGSKYRRGQQEHGGNLWEVDTRQLVDMAIEEAVDQLVYLLTVKDKLTAASRQKE